MYEIHQTHLTTLSYLSKQLPVVTSFCPPEIQPLELSIANLQNLIKPYPSFHYAVHAS
jgi:hypothetical protein